MAAGHSGEDDAPFAAMRRSVRYADRLREYLEWFPPEQMAIRFFDDLKADPRSFMRSLCEFLEIDGGFYDAYSFQVENQTRSYRSRRLHRLVFQINMGLEHWLNRAPRFRNALRRGYNRLNARSAKPLAKEADHARQLRRFFRPDNARLGALLAEVYPDLALPEWIPTPNGQRPGRTERASGVRASVAGPSAG
jgi:hypothetical protein